MKPNHLIISFLYFSAFIYPQINCTIEGNVLDAETGEKIIGANVFIEGMNSGTSSDINANFIIESIPEGKYVLQATYIGYSVYKDTIVLNRENRYVYLTISLRLNRPVIIRKPEIEEYQIRLQMYAKIDSLLRIHIDSLEYQNGGVLVFSTFTNLSDESLYIIKEQSCFRIIKPLVYNEGKFVNGNGISLECDVMPYRLINKSDLIKIEPHKSLAYPTTTLWLYNFNLLPKGEYKVGIKYKFGGPSSLTGIFSKPQDDAILIALRGEYFSDNFMFFSNK